MTEPARLQSILFDLDGTLLDTAPDLAAALNRVLREQGRDALPYEHIRPVVSNGSIGLLRLGFDAAPGDALFDDLRSRLLDAYRANLCVETRLFDGMDQVLNHLESRALPWGVVTNKPAWLTEPLLESLGLRRRAACVVSGDTVARRKPDPEPILHACALMHCPPEASVYVGDARRDIEAGRRAGIRTLAAAFGYVELGDSARAWGADAVLDTPADLLTWLDLNAFRPATQA